MALQMTCPFCKHEFPYDNGKLDANISKTGQRINEIMRRLAEIKYSRKTDDSFKEKRKLTIELEQLKVKIAELKAIRKVCDQQIKRQEYQIFKNLVRERYGETEFHDLLDEMEEELQAYKISETMRRPYSRAGYKADVININKL